MLKRPDILAWFERKNSGAFRVETFRKNIFKRS